MIRYRDGLASISLLVSLVVDNFNHYYALLLGVCLIRCGVGPSNSFSLLLILLIISRSSHVVHLNFTRNSISDNGRTTCIVRAGIVGDDQELFYQIIVSLPMDNLNQVSLLHSNWCVFLICCRDGPTLISASYTLPSFL